MRWFLALLLLSKLVISVEYDYGLDTPIKSQWKMLPYFNHTNNKPQYLNSLAIPSTIIQASQLPSEEPDITVDQQENENTDYTMESSHYYIHPQSSISKSFSDIASKSIGEYNSIDELLETSDSSEIPDNENESKGSSNIDPFETSDIDIPIDSYETSISEIPEQSLDIEIFETLEIYESLEISSAEIYSSEYEIPEESSASEVVIDYSFYWNSSIKYERTTTKKVSFTTTEKEQSIHTKTSYILSEAIVIPDKPVSINKVSSSFVPIDQQSIITSITEETTQVSEYPSEYPIDHCNEENCVESIDSWEHFSSIKDKSVSSKSETSLIDVVVEKSSSVATIIDGDSITYSSESSQQFVTETDNIESTKSVHIELSSLLSILSSRLSSIKPTKLTSVSQPTPTKPAPIVKEIMNAVSSFIPENETKIELRSLWDIFSMLFDFGDFMDPSDILSNDNFVSAQIMMDIISASVPEDETQIEVTQLYTILSDFYPVPDEPESSASGMVDWIESVEATEENSPSTIITTTSETEEKPQFTTLTTAIVESSKSIQIELSSLLSIVSSHFSSIETTKLTSIPSDTPSKPAPIVAQLMNVVSQYVPENETKIELRFLWDIFADFFDFGDFMDPSDILSNDNYITAQIMMEIISASVPEDETQIEVTQLYTILSDFYPVPDEPESITSGNVEPTSSVEEIDESIETDETKVIKSSISSMDPEITKESSSIDSSEFTTDLTVEESSIIASTSQTEYKKLVTTLLTSTSDSSIKSHTQLSSLVSRLSSHISSVETSQPTGAPINRPTTIAAIVKEIINIVSSYIPESDNSIDLDLLWSILIEYFNSKNLNKPNGDKDVESNNEDAQEIIHLISSSLPEDEINYLASILSDFYTLPEEPKSITETDVLIESSNPIEEIIDAIESSTPFSTSSSSYFRIQSQDTSSNSQSQVASDTDASLVPSQTNVLESSSPSSTSSSSFTSTLGRYSFTTNIISKTTSTSTVSSQGVSSVTQNGVITNPSGEAAVINCEKQGTNCRPSPDATTQGQLGIGGSTNGVTITGPRNPDEQQHQQHQKHNQQQQQQQGGHGISRGQSTDKEQNQENQNGAAGVANLTHNTRISTSENNNLNKPSQEQRESNQINNSGTSPARGMISAGNNIFEPTEVPEIPISISGGSINVPSSLIAILTAIIFIL